MSFQKMISINSLSRIAALVSRAFARAARAHTPCEDQRAAAAAAKMHYFDMLMSG